MAPAPASWSKSALAVSINPRSAKHRRRSPRRHWLAQPQPSRANMPNTQKTPAETICTTRIGSIRVIRSPNQTTGALASIMPSVVPATTQNQAQHPGGHGQEGDPENPAQHIRAKQGRHPGAECAGQRMVGQGGHQDACNDGPGLAKTRGQNEREQLRLVAHFGEGDDTCGDEKSFHGFWGSGRLLHKTCDCTASPARPHERDVEAVQSKVSPSQKTACAMPAVGVTSLLTQAPFIFEGRLLPNDRPDCK